jgi:hypothetical protein
MALRQTSSIGVDKGLNLAGDFRACCFASGFAGFWGEEVVKIQTEFMETQMNSFNQRAKILDIPRQHKMR